MMTSTGNARLATIPDTGEELVSDKQVRRDRDYTVRAWMAVMTYLLSDYHFLYE